MNNDTIDEFLFQKTSNSISTYFEFMRPIIELANSCENDLSKEPEKTKELISNFNNKNVKYQVFVSTFVTEIFHVLELYMKSVLSLNGEYFLYASIDDFPKQKAQWLKERDERKNILKELHKKGFAAVSSKKNERSKKILERFVDLLMQNTTELANSVTPKEAMNRLVNFLNWKVTDDVYKKFNLLNQCRNEITHFGYFENITFSSSYALSLVFSFSKSLPEKYPKFSKIEEEYRDRISSYNECVQHIILNETMEPFIVKMKEILIT